MLFGDNTSWLSTLRASQTSDIRWASGVRKFSTYSTSSQYVPRYKVCRYVQYHIPRFFVFLKARFLNNEQFHGQSVLVKALYFAVVQILWWWLGFILHWRFDSTSTHIYLWLLSFASVRNSFLPSYCCRNSFLSDTHHKMDIPTRIQKVRDLWLLIQSKGLIRSSKVRTYIKINCNIYTKKNQSYKSSDNIQSFSRSLTSALKSSSEEFLRRTRGKKIRSIPLTVPQPEDKSCRFSYSEIWERTRSLPDYDRF